MGGSGIIGGLTTISGIHSPGNSPEIQEFTGNLTYESGSTVVWELIDNVEWGPGTNFDRIMVGGNLTFNGATDTTVNLTFNSTGSAVDWDDEFWDLYTIREWQIWGVTGSTSGFPDNVSLSAPANWVDKDSDSFASALGTKLPSQASFYLFQDGNSIYLRYEALPEPGAFGLLGLTLGTLTLGVRGRRRLPVQA